MKKQVFFIFLLINTISFAQETYYFYEGEKVLLNPSNERFYIKFVQGLTENQQLSELLHEIYPDFLIEFESKSGFVIAKNDNLTLQTNEILELLNKSKEIEIANCFYKHGTENAEVGITNKFVVKLLSLGDVLELEKVAKETNTQILEQNALDPNIYVLCVDKKSKGNTLEMANYFYETGLFDFSEPSFCGFGAKQCANDAYFLQQWNLSNYGQNGGTIGADISMCQAWTITNGSENIKIAIIDEGIALNHPDLDVYQCYDATDDGDCIPDDVHGTQCAGIIGASRNNNIGIAGVAPECKLLSVRTIRNAGFSYWESTWIADGFNWAWQNGADVISFSWGNNYSISNITSAINNAVTYGRNGLGSIVTVSTGNHNESSVYFPANLSNTIAVGASSRSDYRCDFSNYGNDIDIVAPGVDIYTTTFPSIGNGYDSNFYGTSAACPHAAGVMALILSVNPCLTATEARAILCKSCDKLPNYKYCNSTYGFWNQEVGYGRINAYKALLMALGLFYEYQETGIVGQATSIYQWSLANGRCTGLASSTYSVQRYEVTKTITFPYTENPIVQVSTNGFSAASPNQGNNYYSITNVTHTSADLKTWKYKIVTGNGSQTYIPSGDVWFKYIVYDDNAPIVYVSNKTINNTTYNRTALEKLVLSDFTVQGNSDVELRAGDEIVFNTETSIKPTSTGVVQAKAGPFVSCENNREIQNESSDLFVNEMVVLKSFSDENTEEIINDIEKDIIPVVLFPNPTKDEITVRFNNEIGNKGLIITINDFSGNKIEEITSTDKETPINVLHYSNGVYIITIKNNEVVYKKTFIKK